MSVLRIPSLGLLTGVLVLLLVAGVAAAGDDKPPKGKALKKAVIAYLDADRVERERMRARWDEELARLSAKALLVLSAV